MKFKQYISLLSEWMKYHPETETLNVYSYHGSHPVAPKIVECNGKVELSLQWDTKDRLSEWSMKDAR